MVTVNQTAAVRSDPAIGFSMADLMETVSHHVSRELVPAAACNRINSLTSPFPPLSGAILECRLDDDSASPELSIRATVLDGGREFLACPFGPLRNLAGSDPIWQGIRRFCAEWKNPRSPISRNVENLWLEFDLGPTAELPRPCVFFDAAQDPRSEPGWITDCALPLLLGGRLGHSTISNLEVCFELLRRGARVHYLGMMAARNTESVRVNLRVETDQVGDYLHRIGLPFSDEGFDVAETAKRFSSRVTLDLDVDEAIHSTVGVELKPDSKSDWPVLLREMGKTGLCPGSLRAALLAWPGWSGRTHPSTKNVEVSFYQSGFRAGLDAVISVRRLNHVKIVCRPTVGLYAKAYLYAGFGWSRNGAGEAIENNAPARPTRAYSRSGWSRGTILRASS